MRKRAAAGTDGEEHAEGSDNDADARDWRRADGADAIGVADGVCGGSAGGRGKDWREGKYTRMLFCGVCSKARMDLSTRD